MIHFSLCCDHGHDFDGWFRDNADFDQQKAKGLVRCPICNSAKVEKTLMTPNVSTSKKRERLGMGLNNEERDMLNSLQELTRQIKNKAENVGERFAEEARKIHFGEVDPRAIYGHASHEEVKSLLDDGVDVMPLPDLPEDKN